LVRLVLARELVPEPELVPERERELVLELVLVQVLEPERELVLEPVPVPHSQRLPQ